MSGPTKDPLAGASKRIAIGVIIGQALIFGVTPVISRLYAPDAVGRAGLFLAVASVIGSISAWRWETRLPRAHDEEKAAYVSLAIACIVATCLTTLIIAVPFLGPAEAALLALTCVGLGCITVGMQWSARVGDMHGLAASKVTQGALQAGSQVLAGLTGVLRLGLQLGLALGYLGSALTQWGVLRRRGQSPRLSRSAAARVSAAEWRSTIGLTFAAIINLGTVWAQLFILSAGHTATDVGHFSLAQRLSLAPAGLLVAALAPPLLSRVGERMRVGEDVWEHVRHLILKLAPVTLVLTAALVLVPRTAVQAILGTEWGPVKDYAAAISPLIFGLIVVGPASQVLAVIGDMRGQLRWDITRAATVFTTGGICLWAGVSPVTLTLVTSLVLFVWYILYLVIVRRSAARLASLRSD